MPRQRKGARRVAADSAPPPHVAGLAWAGGDVPSAVEWEVPGLLPRGAIVLLEGRKSTGKSTMSAAFAAGISGGRAVPGQTVTRARPVIWCAGEDPWAEVVLPRLKSAGANLSHIARPDCRDAQGKPRRMKLPGDTLILEEAIRDSGAGMVVLDPYASAADPALDLRVEQQARCYLEPLAYILAKYQCLGLLTRHLRKGSGGDAREAGLGSVAIANVARVVLRCDEHPHQPGDFVMSVVASNYGKRPLTSVYRVVDAPAGGPAIEWRGVCNLDADTIAEGRGSEADRDEWGEADRLLFAVIGSAWVAVAVIESEAEDAAISPRTLRRAKARLGIRSRRVTHGAASHWEWGPPVSGDPPVPTWPPGLGG